MTDAISLDFKAAALKKQTCFSQLTDEEIHVLAGLLKEKLFEAGATIVTEGDIVDSVYLIIQGTAEVRHVTIQNCEAKIEVVAKLGPEAAIGLNEHGFYSISGVRTATVVALSKMVTLRLNTAAFHGFALAYPHVNEVMRQNSAALHRN